MGERADLEHRVQVLEERLRETERALILMPDPIERQRLRKEVEGFQEELFMLRTRVEELAAGHPTEPESEGPQQHPRRADRPTVFLSFSHADRAWVKRLLVHLKPLDRAQKVRLWDDRRIKRGQAWRNEIREALDSARAAIVLVSADFLASDFVADEELPLLLDRASREGLHVLPILLGPCDFWSTRLANFQFVNSPSSPLSSKTREEQEQVLASVADSVEKVLATPA